MEPSFGALNWRSRLFFFERPVHNQSVEYPVIVRIPVRFRQTRAMFVELCLPDSPVTRIQQIDFRENAVDESIPIVGSAVSAEVDLGSR